MPSEVPRERRFSRSLYLPRHSGELHIRGQSFSQQSTLSTTRTPIQSPNLYPVSDPDPDDPFLPLADENNWSTNIQLTPSLSTHKKERQWENWTKNVIPSLIPIYLDLICRSKSLRTLDDVRVLTSLPCECRKRTLRVALVSFDSAFYFLPPLTSCSPSTQSSNPLRLHHVHVLRQRRV